MEYNYPQISQLEPGNANYTTEPDKTVYLH